MADPSQLLHAAAADGDLAAVQACLAAGADPNVQDPSWMAPLHGAASGRHADCVTALLAAGANSNARSKSKHTPLHCAAFVGCTACVAALLAAGARPTAVSIIGGTPAHNAAVSGHVSVLRQLLAADPAVALQRTRDQRTPLAAALQNGRLEAARCLLAEARLLSADAKLTAVEQVLPNHPSEDDRRKAPLYTMLVELTRLTAEQWARIPTPCAGLGAALPAVLERSTEEACLLVHRLTLADRARLRTFAASLARVQQCLPAPLPTPITWRLLALSVAG